MGDWGAVDCTAELWHLIDVLLNLAAASVSGAYSQFVRTFEAAQRKEKNAQKVSRDKMRKNG
jgi:hypothetical protein